jgi:glycosyltransferase involved in cell wall biosynthesis
MQRVATVDALFRDVPRRYLDIAFKRIVRHRTETKGLVTVERANFFLHRRLIRRRLEEARWIYVHSVLNGLRLFPELRTFRGKIVTDFHGIAPEEMRLERRILFATLLQLVERSVVRNSSRLVVVTHSMARHLLAKYPRDVDAARLVTLPIFDYLRPSEPLPLRPPLEGRGLRLIYAGGTQRWQNIDLMLKTLASLASVHPDLQARIYVPPAAVPGLQRKVSSAGLNPRVTVGSVSREELPREYSQADAGFVLRDDNVVNRVAMPTKLVEYMNYGVVPVVLSPHIGDFGDYGYRCLRIDDLMQGRNLSESDLEAMRISNRKALVAIEAERTKGEGILRSLVTACPSRALAEA